MDQAEDVKRSRAVALGILAVACAALFPVMLGCAIALGFGFSRVPGMIGILTFVASFPLAILAWRIGSKDLGISTAGAPSMSSRRGASLGRRLGKNTTVFWLLFALVALLTYTRPI
jgi:hypothetical protein